MSMTPTGIARTVALWVQMIFDAALLTMLFFTHNFVWFGVFLFITLWIVTAEVWGLLVGYPAHGLDRLRSPGLVLDRHDRACRAPGGLVMKPLGDLYWSLAPFVAFLYRTR